LAEVKRYVQKSATCFLQEPALSSNSIVSMELRLVLPTSSTSAKALFHHGIRRPKGLVCVDMNSFGRLDLTVFIALIFPVYISTTWIRRSNN
jgi:hypothetical protein